MAKLPPSPMLGEGTTFYIYLPLSRTTIEAHMSKEVNNGYNPGS